MSLPWTVKPGEQYGAAVDAVFAHTNHFSREDWLRLAYAALDQGVTRADLAEARTAFKDLARPGQRRGDQPKRGRTMKLLIRTDYSDGDAQFAYVEIDADDVDVIRRRVAAFKTLRAADADLAAIDFDATVYFYPGEDENIEAAIGDAKHAFVGDDFVPSTESWTETECDVMTLLADDRVRFAGFEEYGDARVVSEAIDVAEMAEAFARLATTSGAAISPAHEAP